MAVSACHSLQSFLSDVTATLQEQKSGVLTEDDVRDKVRSLMHEYLQHGDKEYVKHIRFCDLGYSRTHVVKNDHFELLVRSSYNSSLLPKFTNQLGYLLEEGTGLKNP